MSLRQMSVIDIAQDAIINQRHANAPWARYLSCGSWFESSATTVLLSTCQISDLHTKAMVIPNTAENNWSNWIIEIIGSELNIFPSFLFLIQLNAVLKSSALDGSWRSTFKQFLMSSDDALIHLNQVLQCLDRAIWRKRIHLLKEGLMADDWENYSLGSKFACCWCIHMTLSDWNELYRGGWRKSDK